jgi:hypothetical protein
LWGGDKARVGTGKEREGAGNEECPEGYEGGLETVAPCRVVLDVSYRHALLCTRLAEGPGTMHLHAHLGPPCASNPQYRPLDAAV